MSKYFGTDGIRGKANLTLNNNIAYKLALSLYKNTKAKKIVIARDTRISGTMFASSIASGLCRCGVDVYDLKVCSTPCLAYICMKEKFDFGIMISASHNPYYDNGIKVFTNEGTKISNQLEDEIEKDIDSYTDEEFQNWIDTCNKDKNLNFVPLNEKIGQIFEYDGAINEYINWLKTLYPLSLEKFKVLVDCANGSNSNICQTVLEELNCDCTIINNKPNGININDKCGSTHLEMLQEEILKENYDLGFAFDGDADRVLIVSKDGKIIDGDSIMFMLARYLKDNKRLNNNTLVTTVMSNIGLFKALKKYDINTTITDVGDKNVLDSIIDNNYSVGGEQSGHVIIKEDSLFGDGLKTILAVFNAILYYDLQLEEILKDIKVYPQILKNIVVKDKTQVLQNTQIKNKIYDISNRLGQDGRILVRPSGTEPLIRVMVEAESEDICNTYINEVIDLIKKLNY